MKLFERMDSAGHEQVVFCNRPEVGLKAIIAIHDTTLGPALGGVRMWPYKTEEEALTDVLRLSEGMTYKAAAAGLNLGGGKAVIIGDPKSMKSEALFRAFGRFVETLNGRYITAEDVGIDINDLEYVRLETSYVTGVATHHGGSGDPSPFTASGVQEGIKASLHYVKGSDSLNGVTVAVQGLGNVGYNLCKLLNAEGAKLVIADIDEERVNRAKREFPDAKVVSTSEIHGVQCDVFAPCALGAIINDKTINELKCKIVAGAANNQLAETRHGDILFEKKILYAPDYVINAGGLMNVYVELEGYSETRARRLTRNIYYSLSEIYKDSARQSIPTNKSADRLAKDRLKKMDYIKKTYLRNTFNRFSKKSTQ